MPCGCWNCSQSKVSPVLFHTEGDVWVWDSWTDHLAVLMFAENHPATCSAELRSGEHGPSFSCSPTAFLSKHHCRSLLTAQPLTQGWTFYIFPLKTPLWANFQKAGGGTAPSPVARAGGAAPGTAALVPVSCAYRRVHAPRQGQLGILGKIGLNWMPGDSLGTLPGSGPVPSTVPGPAAALTEARCVQIDLDRFR